MIKEPVFIDANIIIQQNPTYVRLRRSLDFFCRLFF